MFLDFLNTLTLATSPTNVFRLLKFILAKEPVNAESVIVCPSTNSKVVVYGAGTKISLTEPLLEVNGVSTITSLLLNTSITFAE